MLLAARSVQGHRPEGAAATLTMTPSPQRGRGSTFGSICSWGSASTVPGPGERTVICMVAFVLTVKTSLCDVTLTGYLTVDEKVDRGLVDAVRRGTDLSHRRQVGNPSILYGP